MREEGRKEGRKRILVLSVDCPATITMKENFIIHISILASSPLARNGFNSVRTSLGTWKHSRPPPPKDPQMHTHHCE